MKFLVTNDDGSFAPGLEALVEVLLHFGEVHVVCPDQESSAASHSITLNEPVKAAKMSLFGPNVPTWAINGTPADCIKLGLDILIEEPPDFVISGINLGPNLGRDVHYSGTMAAASEAALYGIPAIAVSLDRLSSHNTNFQYPKRLLYEVLETLLANQIPKGVFVNINLPYIGKEACRGVRVVPLDLSVNRYSYVGLNDANGYVYYWLKDNLLQLTDFAKESDFATLKEGYITITPLEGKACHTKHIRKFEKWFRQSVSTFKLEEFYSEIEFR